MNRYTYKGVEYPSVAALARATGVPLQRLYHRLDKNWPVEDAVEFDVFDPSTSGKMGGEVSGWADQPLFPRKG